MANTQTKSLSKLWKLLMLEKAEIFSIYFYAILSGLIQLSVPIGVQAIIGFVIGATMVTSIYVLIFLVVLGVLIAGFIQINQMKIIEKVQQRIFTRNAFEFAEKIPNLDLKSIDNAYLPEKINYFFDTLNVQKGLSKILLDLPLASIQIFFGLLVLSFYHPIFIVFGIILIGLLFVVLKLSSPKGLQTSLEESKHKYKVVAWLEEMARVIKTIKYSQGTNLNLIKTDKNVVNYLNSRTSHFNILLIQYKTLVYFKVAITAAMLLVGTTLLLNQKLNIGEFIAAEIIILSILGAVEKLIVRLETVYDVVTGLEKTGSILALKNERNGSNNLDITNGVSIEAIDINFGYSDDVKIIDNISFEINANSISVLTGESGAGKSSILKLLSGGFAVNSGSILINRIPIKNYHLKSLRQNTGIYLEEQDVIEGTILENIIFGRNTININQIMDLAYQLGIEKFLIDLPNGFETIINSTGNKLASSNTKKLKLLRALINNPKILLLEEPQSGLNETEKQMLINYLQKISKATTIVIATNDEKMKACANQILTMQQGQILK